VGLFGIHCRRIGRVEFHWRHVRIRTKEVIETVGMGGLKNHLGFFIGCIVYDVFQKSGLVDKLNKTR